MNLDALPLSRKQIVSIAESTQARISIWTGAVRSGKTIASLIAFLIAVAAAPPSGLIVIVGRTLQTIERNIIEPLQDRQLFGFIAAEVQHTRGSTTVTILGRTVHLIGASDARAEGRIRGLTAYLVLVDEATLIPEGFWNQVLARLSVPGARLLATTNPDSPAHWLRKKFLLRAGELSLASWHFTLDDNPSLAADYVAALKREYVGLWYRRFILGEWCQAEGANWAHAPRGARAHTREAAQAPRPNVPRARVHAARALHQRRHAPGRQPLVQVIQPRHVAGHPSGRADEVGRPGGQQRGRPVRRDVQRPARDHSVPGPLASGHPSRVTLVVAQQ